MPIPRLSPYPRIGQIGPNERQDPYHYGLSLIEQIRDCPGQEIGTHTFSHYYCLEPGETEDGQSEATFRADLLAARRAAERLGITPRSLVFPRNQYRADYLEACRAAGLEVVRGNHPAWWFRAESRSARGPGQARLPAERRLPADLAPRTACGRRRWTAA